MLISRLGSLGSAGRLALVLTLSLAGNATAAPEECAGSTPEKTWTNASEAVAAGELITVAACVAPQHRQPMAFRLLSLSGQLMQLEAMTNAEEGSEELVAHEQRVREVSERLTKLLRKHGLPASGEEAKAIDAKTRQKLMAAIDYPVMITDLILFIESLEEDQELQTARGAYFTSGELGKELTRVSAEGESATGWAVGKVEMVQAGGRWYLVPPM